MKRSPVGALGWKLIGTALAIGVVSVAYMVIQRTPIPFAEILVLALGLAGLILVGWGSGKRARQEFAEQRRQGGNSTIPLVWLVGGAAAAVAAFLIQFFVLAP